jgi:hypothetical protein
MHVLHFSIKMLKSQNYEQGYVQFNGRVHVFLCVL